ncbi:MAG TPA: hypothetical protein VGP72_33370 [Planctomycetota bacterium]|jgi:hypothetical protein
MEMTPGCMFCARPALYQQGIIGTAKAKNAHEVHRTLVYSCESCKADLEVAAAAVMRRKWILLAAWVVLVVGLFLISPIVLDLMLLPSLLFLWIAHVAWGWMFNPPILKDAQKKIQSSADGLQISFAELGGRWRKIGVQGHSANCTRCGISKVTHQFQAIGQSQTATEGVIEKKNIYAQMKVEAPLCEMCAEGLRRCMNHALLLKACGALLIAMGVVAYGVRAFGGFQASTSGEWAYGLLLMSVPFGIVALVAFALMSVVSYYTIEYPWIAMTEVRELLGAEGFDASTVKIAGRPRRIEALVEAGATSHAEAI